MCTPLAANLVGQHPAASALADTYEVQQVVVEPSVVHKAGKWAAAG